ncbi:hypothetical protein KYJ26_20290 [Bacillus sp. MCCB 382]|uniref:hypothetical protein n=1 Tax=Bacillus sp. MCCB 382 TaxID=2860197 RepID=UPI001C58F5DA|nr:hypothetical protein [Bacillus sp. MCCB 382]
MNRSETVEKIEELLRDHEECGSCQTCKEVDSLRNKLLHNPKVKAVLDKGSYMKKSDIAFLIGKDIERKEIKKALGMSTLTFQEMMVNWGFSKKRGDSEMAKLKDFTTNEYNDLKAVGLNDEQVAEKKGVSTPTLTKWKKDNGISSGKVFGRKKDDKEPKVFKPTITPKETVQPPQNELQSVVETLKRQLDVREKAINQQFEKIEHLKATTVPREKYKNMKIDFEEAELERIKNFEEYKKMENAYQKEHAIVINLDAELENVREQLRQARVEAVRAGQENEHLKGLVKLWM